MNKTATISQLLNTPDGTYINASVTGYLTGIRPPNGKGPSKAKLSDGSHQIEVSLWGGGVTQWEGQQVTFSGKGMKIQEYKGTKSLSVGDKVNIGAADVNPDLEASRAPVYTPSPLAPDLEVVTRRATQNAPSNLPVNLPHGATVGMCVKAAVDLWIATKPTPKFEGDGADWVYGAARNLIRISQHLERGEDLNESVPF